MKTVKSPSGTDQLLLAIDQQAWPLRDRVCLHLNPPAIRTEPVLEPSAHSSNAPDNAAAQFFGTVIHDNGRYRMWYYACHQGVNPDWSPGMRRQLAARPIYDQGDGTSDLFPGPLCYAESDDGVTWNKPALEQVVFKGTASNNALALPHAALSTPLVIKDDTDAEPARRYKMVYELHPSHADPPYPEWGDSAAIVTATSADGIHWSVGQIPYLNEAIEPSSFIRHNGAYIVHHHQMHDQYRSEGGGLCGRTGIARLSNDFDHWLPGGFTTFALPEPGDLAERGFLGTYDQVHLGIGAASFGNVCVGLFGRWHNAHFTEAFADISCDLGLVISRDGIHFHEPVKGHNVIERTASACEPIPGKTYHTILCQGNGILNVGDQTLIYHGRWRNVGMDVDALAADYHANIALATLPRNRWGSLRLYPDTQRGAVWTEPLTITKDSALSLNADGVSGIVIEIGDADYTLLPEWSGDNAGTISGTDGLACPIDWGERDIRELTGTSVRLRLTMTATDCVSPAVYALDHRHTSRATASRC